MAEIRNARWDGEQRRYASDILVVDDDPANLLAIEAALSDLEDARLIKARSGSEALRQLLEHDFALILLDVHMPEMDGFSTARLIRARPRTRHVPIVFITAYSQSDARVLEGYVLGAVDFLFKPIVPEVLRAKANVFMELQRRASELGEQADQLRQHERRESMRRLVEERNLWEQEALRRQMEEQRRVAEQLQRKTEELERTVAEREAAQRELRRINAQLEETDRRKDEFLAMLAHELRNPLAPLSYAVGLLEGAEDPVLCDARERLERQLSHISRLVDDLLDVSRVTSGKIELRLSTMDLRDAVRHAVEVSTPSLEERAHALVVEVPPEPLVVRGDIVRLSQVISNLLNNAARYTPLGGHIAVRASKRGENAIIEVTDDGRGIEPELIDRIFGAFVQGGAGDGGLGLGLHVVSHLVRLHGGAARAYSDGVGKGSRFEITLPLSEAELAPAEVEREPQAETPAAPTRLRIVVIEDQEDVRQMVVVLLERWGHEVIASDTGGEGLRLIAEHDPDVALVDIGLPDMDGYEVAARARAELGAKCPPLIAVTGWGQDSDRRRALEGGFSKHLIKPVRPKDLKSLLLTIGAERKRDAA
jgi:signal transduction histidine kinase